MHPLYYHRTNINKGRQTYQGQSRDDYKCTGYTFDRLSAPEPSPLAFPHLGACSIR